MLGLCFSDISMLILSVHNVTFILVYFPIKHKIVRDGFRLLESMALANREKQ